MGNKQSVATAGGIIDLVVALRTHRNDAGVQQESCRKLAALAAFNAFLPTGYKLEPDGALSVVPGGEIVG